MILTVTPNPSLDRTLEEAAYDLGAGRFDPRQAGRLQAGVVITELNPVEV